MTTFADFLPLAVQGRPTPANTSKNMMMDKPHGVDQNYPREQGYFTLSQRVESFLQMLRRMDLLSRTGWRQRGPVVNTKAAFELGGSLHSLLAPASSQEPPIGGHDLHENARLACLLLICQSLLDLDAPSSASDEYMAEVEAALESVKVSAHHSNRAFLHFHLRTCLHLLLKIRYPGNFDWHACIEQSYQNAQVAKRLGRRSRSRVGHVLLDYVTGNGMGLSLPLITDRDADRIRNEALWFQSH